MFEKVEITKMNQSEAVIIADTWKYPAAYDFYDMTADPEDYQELINEEERGNHYFSVKEQGELVGFFCIFPQDEQSVEIGVGMKPEVTGNGFGKKFVHLVLDHVNHQFQNPEIWLSVAQFNQRAIKVYENAGFVKVDEIQQANNGGVYDFVRMKNQ